MTSAVFADSTVGKPARDDFVDWLSPILVKELRQGLKSRVFVSVFMLLQGATILFVGLRLISISDGSTSRNAAGMFDSIFWICLWVPLLVMMPARGLGAIGEEKRAQTLDLVQLTRLTAFRIVWGKWLALVAQTALLVTAMLPYAVLRYYFGQTNVAEELLMLGMMLVVSMVLTAGAVALSAAPLAFRVVALMMLLPLWMTYAVSLVMGPFGSGSVGSWNEGVWWGLGASALYIFFFLEMAASKIAPQAENHSARKRALALGAAALAALAGWLWEGYVFAALLGICAPMMVVVVLEALCEVTAHLPGIYAAFARRGFTGRLMGRLLYPGWATGTLCAAGVCGLLWIGAAGMAVRFVSGTDLLLLKLLPIMTFFALVSPLPLMEIFPRIKRRLVFYLVIQMACLLIFVVGLLAGQGAFGQENGLFNLLSLVPTAALCALLKDPHENGFAHWASTVGLGADLLLTVWLGFLVARQLRVIRRMERQSLQEQPPAPAIQV